MNSYLEKYFSKLCSKVAETEEVEDSAYEIEEIDEDDKASCMPVLNSVDVSRLIFNHKDEVYGKFVKTRNKSL